MGVVNRHKGEDFIHRGPDPEADRLRAEVKALKDRVAVLERLATDDSTALEREFSALGVTFDLWNGESTVDGLIPSMLEDLKARGLTEISEGALVVPVARDDDKKPMPPLILLKSEGGVLYGTTDLATIIERHVAGSGICTTAMPHVSLIRADAPSTPTPAVYEASLCLIAQGSKRVSIGEHSVVYDAAHYLLVSVDLPLVGHIADVVSVMYLGRIVETGTRDEVFDRPLHPYTRALLGAASDAVGGSSPVGLEPTGSRPTGCAFRDRCPIARAACAGIVARGKTLRIDAGRVEGRHFLKSSAPAAPLN